MLYVMQSRSRVVGELQSGYDLNQFGTSQFWKLSGGRHLNYL